MDDSTLKRAFVRSLEVIGEAAKHIPEELQHKHPQVQWRAMAGMRDRLISGYFGVDYLSYAPRLALAIRQVSV